MAVQEKIVPGGLDLNDDTNFVLEDLVFTPAQKKPQWIDSPDADGELLLEEPHYTNAKFEMRVRVQTRGTMDLALAALGQIQDMLQSCARAADDGGVATPWTPANSTKTYTWYAVLGEVANWPIQPSGELAGWFIKSPVINITLTCRPFGYGAQTTVLAATASSLPAQEVLLGTVGGDVDAEGELAVTDTATQDRRHVEWGLTSRSDNAALAMLIDSDSLTTTGFSGSGNTRGGAYDPNAAGNSVVRGTVVADPVALCSTGELAHCGTFRVKARVYAGSTDVRVRFSYRVGDGPLTSLAYVAPCAAGAFVELDLGEISITKLSQGTHRWEGRVEAKSITTNTTLDVDYLLLIPTERYGVARGPATSQATSILSAFDEFGTSSAALAAKVADLGGTWSGAGDTDDFTVTGGVAQRTAVSDSSLTNGRFGILGSTNYAASKITATLYISAGLESGADRIGLLLRYIDTSNWAMAVFERSAFGTFLSAYKCVAGVVTTLGYTAFPTTTGATLYFLEFEISADGSWVISSSGNYLATGQDSALATGGTLASGKPGIYDAHTSAIAKTRQVYQVFVYTPEAVRRALHSGRSIRFTHQATERENSGGTRWGQPPLYRGSRFYLPPGANDRLVVKSRRNDVALEQDANVADAHSIVVKATPRYLAPR